MQEPNLGKRKYQLATHTAYLDESTQGDYSGISIVSCQNEHLTTLKVELSNILQELETEEFKWTNTRKKTDRSVVKKMIDFSLKYIAQEILRIDVLIWKHESSNNLISNHSNEGKRKHDWHPMFLELLNQSLK